MGLNDGRDHRIALRYIRALDCWYFIVDGFEEGEMTFKNAPDPPNSSIRIDKTSLKQYPDDKYYICWSSIQSEFETLFNEPVEKFH